jgi:hypothetical protein
MLHRPTALALAALLAACSPHSPARGGDELNVSPGATRAGPGLAVRGYDVVAYFEEGRPELGSEQYTLAHRGGTYRFASQAHLDAFKQDPNKYVPAYGGFCAYGATKGKKFDGDPLRWKIVNGRLYLNLDSEVQSEWSKDIPGNVEKADENWRRIEHTPADEL